MKVREDPVGQLRVDGGELRNRREERRAACIHNILLNVLEAHALFYLLIACISMVITNHKLPHGY